MRPLKLELTGFACFRETQFIDFTELELFAIQGPTGAGKSSILDAITFALYGQTPRLGARGLDALIAQGAPGLSVSLEFETNGERYRVTRVWNLKARERQPRFERSVDERWHSATEGVRVAEINAAIEQVVGLNFDGFTRAVMLPQGEFDRFLRGDARSRRELLRGLLQLELFEQMRTKAGEIASQAKANRDRNQFLLEGEYAEATAQALEDAHEKSKTVLQARSKLAAELSALQQTAEQWREIAKLERELDKARTRRLELEQQNASIQADATRARRARQASALIPRQEAALRAQKSLEQAEQEWRKGEFELERVLELEGKALLELERASEAAAALPRIETRLQELAGLNTRLERLRALGGNLSDASDEEIFDEARLLELEELRGQLPIWNRLEADLLDLGRDSERLGATTRQNETSIQETRLEQEQCKQLGAACKAQLDELKTRLRSLHAEHSKSLLTADLVPGDPCPVCGSPLDKIPTKPHEDLHSLEEEGERLASELEGLRGDYRLYSERLTSFERELKQTQLERARLERRQSTLIAERSKLTANCTKVLGELAKTPNELENLIRTAKTRLLSGLAREILELTDGANPSELIRSLREQKLTLQAQEREAQTNASSVRERSTATRLQVELATQRRIKSLQEYEERAQELKTALEAVGFQDSEELRAAILTETVINTLEEAVRRHEESRTGTLALENELLGSLGGRSLEPGQLEHLEIQLNSLGQELALLIRQEGELEQTKSNLERKVTTRRELEREAASAQQRHALYARLELDLRGNAFQEFMLTRMQERLLERASTIMREVTDDRFSLALENGEYFVLDAWNSLEPRSVKTLSGGESFIASLSLALALSDDLAHNRSLGALFLDEGFGTLDPVSLESVALVLETLQTHGRMVGVITHVSALAERLPARITVKKGVSSSKIELEF